MALEIKLSQKLSQSLLMTPQLQQAIKLLQLGRLEYLDAIEKELLENPVLEEFGDEDGSSEKNAAKSEGDDTPNTTEQIEPETDVQEGKPSDDSPIDWEQYLEDFSDNRESNTPRGLIDHEDRLGVEATATRALNLAEHILTQLSTSELDSGDRIIALNIVGNLNRDGYLCISDEELAEQTPCSLEDAKRVIETIQSLEPVGIAARNLSECLLLQLDNIGLGESLSAKVVERHLDLVEKRKYDQIAKAEKVSVEQVYEAIIALRSLEPRPGRQFSDDTTRYITPDIYVYWDNGEWVITLNEDGLPKLRVSPYYMKVLKDSNGQSDNENKNYLNERLKAASWLIKSIHQRQQTIYRVTESIVKKQTAFLESGIEHLKPLVLKEVADDIGMHESTVSRATTNKYVHTPQGVFELKFFFTTGIQTSEGAVSSSSIKEKIKNIISAEPADQPISDQAIVDMLKGDEIKIARRTVAKYRESLGIPSSSKRKKLF